MGGAGIVIGDSFKALRSAGIDVELVAGFGEDSTPDEEVTWLNGADLRAGSALDAVRIVYNRHARDRVAPILSKRDPDRTLVILHQWTRYLTPSVVDLLSRFSTMVYMHDYFWACPNGAYFDFQRGVPCWRRPMGAACITANCDRQGRSHKMVRVARHAMLEGCSRAGRNNRVMLHISHLARRTAEPLLPDEHHALVYNPLYLPVPTDPMPYRMYDVGYVGRLEPEKGVGQLLELAQQRSLKALFVGEGSLASRIEASGATRLGWQPHSAMTELMRSCRVVALPSLWPETWGLVTPEAINAGVPVLVSQRAGSAELIERLGGGAIFDPDLAGDLEFKLNGLLQAEPESITTVATRRTALNRLLSPEAHAERIVTLASEHFGFDLRG